jgi:guanylate kinase
MDATLTNSSGRLIILTGPSGVGKGTLLAALRTAHPEINLSISATTRAPRPGEVDGVNYYFYDRERFEQAIAQRELLEWAEFAGNYYGTPSQPVQERIDRGESIILEIELLGARQVAKAFPDALKIFILLPIFEVRESRLRSRGQDPEEAIARRLTRAQAEIDAAGEFDLQIVNDDLAIALQQIEQAIFTPEP